MPKWLDPDSQRFDENSDAAIQNSPDPSLLIFRRNGQTTQNLLSVRHLAGYSARPLLSPVLLREIADFGQNSLNFALLREISLLIALFLGRSSRNPQRLTGIFVCESAEEAENRSSP